MFTENLPWAYFCPSEGYEIFQHAEVTSIHRIQLNHDFQTVIKASYERVRWTQGPWSCGGYLVDTRHKDKALAFAETLVFLFVLHAQWDVTTGEFYFSSSLWLSFDLGVSQSKPEIFHYCESLPQCQKGLSLRWMECFYCFQQQKSTCSHPNWFSLLF